MEAAKSFFLRYSDERLLESTEYGDVFDRARNKTRKNQPPRIYVKGLLIAEEANFLFSYNITSCPPRYAGRSTGNAATSAAPRTRTGSSPSSRRASPARSPARWRMT